MIEAIFRILSLTRKELLAVLKDPRGRFTLFIPPILQCLLYGYVATYDLNDVPYAVLDRDRSGASRDLLAKLDGSPTFRRVANLHRTEDVKTFIDDRRALLVIGIDVDFERKLLSGQPADVQVIADGRNSNTGGTALGYFSAIVAAFNADWRAAHGQAGQEAPRVLVALRAWYNPNLETRWHMIPSLIGTLTLLQTMLLTAMSVAREREEGTFDQLLVSPFRPFEIMAGKALPSVLIGFMQATNILLVAQLWFRIPFSGSFLTLYVGLTMFLLAAVGIGLLLSSIALTMQQAMLYTFMVMMPCALLSGLATPVSNMPWALREMTRANPLRYAIDMAERVYLEGTGLRLLMPDLMPLAVIALLTLSTAAWLFRHRAA
ncbi:MAG: ABC transporter permease [Isosphaeraceae bacterium]